MINTRTRAELDKLASTLSKPSHPLTPRRVVTWMTARTDSGPVVFMSDETEAKCLIFQQGAQAGRWILSYSDGPPLASAETLASLVGLALAGEVQC